MSEQLTHWGKTRDVNYLGAWDVQPGQDLILTIKSIGQETVENPAEKTKEVKTVIHFVEQGFKPMVLNTTNKKAIASALDTPYIENWIGHPIAIFVKRVNAFGKTSDALRVRDKAPDVTVYVCDDCGNVIIGVGNKSASDLVEISKRNCGGKALCVACQKKFKAEMDKKSEPKTEEKPGPVEEEKAESVTETKVESEDEW